MSVPEEQKLTRVTLNLVGGAIGLNGPIACPACGERHLLKVSGLLDETSDEPCYFRCTCGHVWEEPGLPRRVFAELFRAMAVLDPDAWETLRHFCEHHGAFRVTLRGPDTGAEGGAGDSEHDG